jgi:hypothetical protein
MAKVGGGQEGVVQRVLDAAIKVRNYERWPNHLGDCIGPLSETRCDCGLSDLRFAVMALDRAEITGGL